MKSFVYTGLPSRVVFGAGKVLQINEEAELLGIERALVLTTPQQVDTGEMVADILGVKAAGIFSGAAMHTPIEITQAAMKAYYEADADGLISIGGGSTIGLGKAIALRNDAHQIVLPTTYAGSEMTTILGQTDKGEKVTQKSLKVLPETVIYDVDFTVSLPPALSVTSGINAMAHAVEALYAKSTNPILSVFAEQGISALMSALPVIVKTPSDLEARTRALYGAWLCAVCLGSGGVALHHKLCHVLGGSFDLPHAETHTVVLPHALAYNAPAVQPAMDVLSRATGTTNPAQAFFDLAEQSGVPISLKALGMPEDGITRAADIACKNPYWNPRPLERGAIENVIRSAWAGTPPA